VRRRFSTSASTHCNSSVVTARKKGRAPDKRVQGVVADLLNAKKKVSD